MVMKTTNEQNAEMPLSGRLHILTKQSVLIKITLKELAFSKREDSLVYP